LFSRIDDRNIWLVFAAIFLLGVAYGASIALTSLHLHGIGFSKQAIGSLAAIFAGGIVTMALPAGVLIRRFSAKRTLLSCLLGYTVCVSVFPFLRSYAAVGLVRFIDGACSVGIWVSCETILLSRSKPAAKAFVMSIYAVSMAIGYLTGALGARGIYVLTGSMPSAFVIAGCIALSSGLLVLLRLEADARGGAEGTEHSESVRDAAPEASRPAGRISSAQLLYRIKVSCFATFAYGYFQASVVLFLPLFLIEQKGISTERTILIPAIFALGMLLFSNYAGALGDRLGHLRVMRGLASVGMSMILGFVLLTSWAAMCAAIFVAGAALASISPISLALQGHIAEPRDYSRSNAIYNVFYAAGMLIGPPISSAIFERAGGEAMLVHLAVLWASFVVFSLVFAKDDPFARGRRLPRATPATPVTGQLDRNA
jgi:MFS family permease